MSTSVGAAPAAAIPRVVVVVVVVVLVQAAFRCSGPWSLLVAGRLWPLLLLLLLLLLPLDDSTPAMAPKLAESSCARTAPLLGTWLAPLPVVRLI